MYLSRPLRISSLIAVLVACACEDPIVLPPKGGSFTLPNACGSVTAAPDGQIYTWSRTSSSSIRVDARTPEGGTVWSTTLPASAGSGCSGASDNLGNLYTATGDSIFSLNAGTGSIRWRTRLQDAALAIGLDNRIYAGTRAFSNTPASLWALDATSGGGVWRRDIANQAVGVRLDDVTGALYGIRRAGAIAVKPATGNVIWDAPFIGSRDGFDAAISSESSIIVTSNADFFSELDAYSPDGTRKWTNSTSSPRQAIGSPIVDQNGTVYSAFAPSSGAGGAKAAVIAYSQVTGTVQWQAEFDEIVSDLAVDTDRVVYAIARAAPDSAYRVYGIRDGAVASASNAVGITTRTYHPLLIHTNKLLYYVGDGRVVFTPTAGVSPAAPWPMANHDQSRSNRRPVSSLPD